MQKIENNPRPKFVTSTLEVFSQELFQIHTLAETQESLDMVHKLALLSDQLPLLEKQVWWESYKRIKIALHCMQTNEHPEHVFEVPVQL